MKILTRYIALRIFKGIALAFLIVTGIILLVDFVEATRNIGDDGNLSLLQIGGLTLLKTPQLIEETIPFVVLFGVMGALYGLNKRSEIVVLRASGLSAWRFLRPAVFVSAIIGIIWAAVFNPLAACSMAKYHDVLSAAVNAQSSTTANNEKPETTSSFQPKDIWLREGDEMGQIVIHGTLKAESSRTLHDVTFYYYDVVTALPSPSMNDAADEATDETIEGDAAPSESFANTGTQFSRRIDARNATLTAPNSSSDNSSSYWKLQGVINNTGDGQIARDLSNSLPTKLTIRDISDQSRTQSKAAFWNLPKDISEAENAGFSNVGLRLQWHKLLSLPLTLIALTVIAAAVSMGNMRSGGALRLMMAGGAIGFGVYFCNTIINAFGQAQTLPVNIAAWTVPVLALCLGLAYLSRLEDG